MIVSGPTNLNAPTQPSDTRDLKLRELSKEFETVFLTEMLKHTSLNKTASNFGGGVGEDAFGSLLTREYARSMVNAGGIGLAEHVFRALTAQEQML